MSILLVALDAMHCYDLIYPEYGSNITVYNSYLPADADPQWHIKSDELDLDKLIYDTLCVIDSHGNVAMNLLKDAYMEGNVWHLQLQPGIYFSHHKASLSSYDVKNSLAHIKNDSNVYTFMFEDIIDIKELDALNILVELKRPDSMFLKKLCHPSISIARRWKNIEGKEEIMGTGPFKIKENRLPESLTLEANEYYFRGKPFVQEISLIASTKVNPVFYFKSGSFQFLSLLGIRLTAVDYVVASSTVVEAKPPILLFLLLNLHQYPSSNIKFRNWFAHRINRTELLQSLFSNRGQIIDNLFSGYTGAKRGVADKVIFNGEISLLAIKGDVLSMAVAERIQAILISEGYKTKIIYRGGKYYCDYARNGNYNVLVGTIAPFFREAELNMLEFRSMFLYFVGDNPSYAQMSPMNLENSLINESILIPLLLLKREFVVNNKIQFYMSSFKSLYDLQNAWLYD